MTSSLRLSPPPPPALPRIPYPSSSRTSRKKRLPSSFCTSKNQVRRRDQASRRRGGIGDQGGTWRLQRGEIGGGGESTTDATNQWSMRGWRLRLAEPVAVTVHRRSCAAKNSTHPRLDGTDDGRKAGGLSDPVAWCCERFAMEHMG
jgi:hypothetical protein